MYTIDVLDWQVGTVAELSSTNSTSSTKQIICLSELIKNKMALKILIVQEILDSENDDVVEDS